MGELGLLWTGLAGTALGVFASYLSRTTRWMDLLVDSMAGTSGALLMAWFVSPLDASRSSISGATLGLASMGAIFVICLAKIIRGGPRR